MHTCECVCVCVFVPPCCCLSLLQVQAKAGSLKSGSRVTLSEKPWLVIRKVSEFPISLLPKLQKAACSRRRQISKNEV